MFIVILNALKKYLLFSIVVFILFQKVQLIQKWQTQGEGEVQNFIYILLDHPKYCRYWWRNVSFKLECCDDFEKGSVFLASGRVNIGSDRLFFDQKSLKLQSVDDFGGEWSSALQHMQKILLVLFATKDHLVKTVFSQFSFKISALLQAMLLGDDSSLSEEESLLFETTGMLHILAVSGMHVGLMHRLVQKATSRFWRYFGLFTQVATVLAYAVVTGLSASVLRASSMLLVSVWLRNIFFRQVSRWRVFLLVVVGLVLANPWFLIDVGFQLSVLATGTILLFGMGRNWLRKERQSQADGEAWHDLFLGIESSVQKKPKSILSVRGLFGYFWQTASLSCIIQLILAPLLWWHFGQISWVGVVAGPATLWLAPPLFTSSVYYAFLSFVTSLFIPREISSALLFPVKLLVELIVRLLLGILMFFESIFGAYALIEWQDISFLHVFLWYLSVLLVTLSSFSVAPILKILKKKVKSC